MIDFRFLGRRSRLQGWMITSVIVAALLLAHDVNSSRAAETSVVRDTGFQDLLFVNRTRLLVIRVHLDRGEKPFDTAWQEDLKQRLSAVDLDGDECLSETELKQFRDRDDFEDQYLKDLLLKEEIWASDLTPVDGRISFDEFTDFARSQFGGAFLTRSPELEAGTSRPVADSELGRRLFEQFDGNRDGRLTEDEFRFAPGAIRQYDFDNDGALSTEELLHAQGPFRASSIQARQIDQSFRILTIKPETPLTQTLELIMSVIGSSGTRRDGDRSIPLKRFFLPEGALAHFDLDQSESLDRAELRRFLLHPVPLVELQVNRRPLDEASTGVRFLTKPPAGVGVEIRENELGIACLAIDNLQLELVGGKIEPTLEDRMNDVIDQFFTQNDLDSNGYISPDELQILGPDDGTRFFKVYDSDEDEKVFEDEMRPIVERKLRQASLYTRVVGQNLGQDLFTILDINRDSRLSRREMLTVGERIPLWDRNDDQRLSQTEVPQVYQIEFEDDESNLDFPDTIRSMALGGIAGRSVSVSTDGPSWFQRMDRNRDGDVSLREFLGTPEQFAELDQNRDELLDAQEAFAARHRIAAE